MYSLKLLAMNCGPLSEMILGRASGNFSRARACALENHLDIRFRH